MAPEAAPPSRKRIGKYVVTGRIGRGGMGVVYRGFDELLERDVAIKTLTAEGGLDDESRQRFYIEARAAARLQHPNIVTVFELGEDRGLPFIAMEMLSGGDLETLLRSGEELLLQERLDVVIQVCRGLAYAHEFRIVHRDIKPSNVRLLDDGTAKIMDFGIAKLSGTNVTKSGMMVGTVHYMSPEQVRGRTLDGRSDVFSLGVILYELLAGRRPFAGQGATEVLKRIVREPPASLDRDLGLYGPELQRIVDGALAKEPEDRYPSAAALAEDLAAVAAGLPRSAPTVNPQETRDGISLARRRLKEGALEEAIVQLESVVERDPSSVEARRALRQARRDRARRDAPATDVDRFPELDGPTPAPSAAGTRPAPALEPTIATPAPTILDQTPARGRAAATAQASRQAAAMPPVEHLEHAAMAPAAASSGGRGLLLAGGVAVALALLAGAVLALRDRGAPSSTGVAAVPTTAVVPPLPPATTTPAIVDTETTTVPTAGASAEPPAAGAPEGQVRIDAAYPIDVSWDGRSLARRARSPQLTIPAGRQTLVLSAPSVFWRKSVTVDVREGATTTVLAAPLGKLSVRANPDNCKVFLDGTFLDYPPILHRDVAAGEHTVGFRWPDGARSDERVTITAGRTALVTGRRD